MPAEHCSPAQVVPGWYLWQLPAPSQVPAVFRRVPLQMGARQTVSAAYFAHPPIPSQRPVCPQVAEMVGAQI